MQNFLSIKQLQVGYGANIVLDGINAELPIGRIHGIVGKNGQGKTTLLNVLRGKVIPVQGVCLLNEKHLLPNYIAMLDTESYFYPRITGNEYLRLFQLANTKFTTAKWNEVFNLPLEDEIETYSAGMRKKLAFMGVLGLQRPVLLLDEPFNSLDLDTNYLLVDILKLLAEQGTTLLITSHILEPLLSVCDTILWLQGANHTRVFQSSEFEEIAGLMRSSEHNEQVEKVRSLLR